MADIALTIIGWLLRVLWMFMLGISIEALIFFILDGVGHFWHRLGALIGRQGDKANSSVWIQSVMCIYSVALGGIWSYLPSYLITTDGTARGQFAYRWFASYYNIGFDFRLGGLVIDYRIVALEVIGLTAIAVLLILIGNRAGIDNKVERYRQRYRKSKEHTTCDGCLNLRDGGTCHGFSTFLPEGEVRYCYRKRLWGERSGRS
jgi:hypothetical protein